MLKYIIKWSRNFLQEPCFSTRFPCIVGFSQATSAGVCWPSRAFPLPRQRANRPVDWHLGGGKWRNHNWTVTWSVTSLLTLCLSAVTRSINLASVISYIMFFLSYVVKYETTEGWHCTCQLRSTRDSTNSLNWDLSNFTFSKFCFPLHECWESSDIMGTWVFMKMNIL